MAPLQLLCIPVAGPATAACCANSHMPCAPRARQPVTLFLALISTLAPPSLQDFGSRHQLAQRLPYSTYLYLDILAPISIMLCVFLKNTKSVQNAHTFPRRPLIILANTTTKTNKQTKIFPRKHFLKLKLLLAFKPQGKWPVNLK